MSRKEFVTELTKEIVKGIVMLLAGVLVAGIILVKTGLVEVRVNHVNLMDKTCVIGVYNPNNYELFSKTVEMDVELKELVGLGE